MPDMSGYPSLLPLRVAHDRAFDVDWTCVTTIASTHVTTPSSDTGQGSHITFALAECLEPSQNWD